MKKSLLTLSAFVLAFAVAGSAQAIPLADLINGGSIVAGDQLFDQWSLILNAHSAKEPDLTNIEVTSLNNGGDNPGPGLLFNPNGELDVTGDSIYAFNNLVFIFRVSPLSAKQIRDSVLFITHATLVNGVDVGIAITEQVRDVAGNLQANNYLEYSELNSVITRHWVDESPHFTPESEIYVTENILTWAVDPNDQAALQEFGQRFSQVPEPTSLALFGLGLLGIGCARRRLI